MWAHVKLGQKWVNDVRPENVRPENLQQNGWKKSRPQPDWNAADFNITAHNWMPGNLSELRLKWCKGLIKSYRKQKLPVTLVLKATKWIVMINCIGQWVLAEVVSRQN